MIRQIRDRLARGDRGEVKWRGSVTSEE